MFRVTFDQAEVFGGPTRIQSSLDVQRKVKNGRIGKANNTLGIRKASKARHHKETPKKKGVNSFLLFRSKCNLFQYLKYTRCSCIPGMAMMLFHDRPQSERSAMIRVMWEKERHKSSWSLMARVWTFIRDHSEYDNIWQYLCGAIDLIRTVSPDVWLKTYNMVLVKDNDGNVTLRQYAEPVCINAPRDLSDFELLKGVVMRGLAVEDPEGLLRKMLQHSNHLMTITTLDANASTDDTAKADDDFVNSMNHNPLATFAELLGLPDNTDAFDFGVNVIDVDDVTHFDESLVTTTGDHTHLRYQFDTSTAHLAQPESGSLQMSPFDGNIALDLDMPHQWQNYSGQITQGDFQNSMFSS